MSLKEKLKKHKNKILAAAALAAGAGIGVGAHVLKTHRDNKRELRASKIENHIVGGMSDLLAGYNNHVNKLATGQHSNLKHEMLKSLAIGRGTDHAIDTAAHRLVKRKYGNNPFADTGKHEFRKIQTGQNIKNAILSTKSAIEIAKMHRQILDQQ